MMSALHFNGCRVGGNNMPAGDRVNSASLHKWARLYTCAGFHQIARVGKSNLLRLDKLGVERLDMKECICALMPNNRRGNLSEATRLTSLYCSRPSRLYVMHHTLRSQPTRRTLRREVVTCA